MADREDRTDTLVRHAIMGIGPNLLLCRVAAQVGQPIAASGGVCPIHQSDSCLYMFLPARDACEEALRLVTLARDETWPPPPESVP